MDDDDKKPYNAKAAQAKIRYEEAMKLYKKVRIIICECVI